MRDLLQKHEFESRLLNVNELARETVALVSSDATARDVRIDTELVQPPPHVMGDKVRLQQVLLNLLLNGLDALSTMPVNRRQLCIRTASRNGQVDIEVSDTGAGISDEALARILEPFFSTKAHGMGVGLSIAHGIIDAHGGRMVAENNREGGATIRCTVPRVEPS